MRYPHLYTDFYKKAIENNWTIEEISFQSDKEDLLKEDKAVSHMIKRLVAFFATGDSIVSNNLVLSLYKVVNSPEARLYYSRQLFEESVHVDFYLRLLDEYIPDDAERIECFQAVENIPSIKKKADFAFKWIDDITKITTLDTIEEKRRALLNIIAFAACIEGLFFMGAFTYVFWLRSKGKYKGFGDGTNWVFRDESMHMDFAFAIVDIVRSEYPELVNDEFKSQVVQMMKEAIECEMSFCEDAVMFGLPGINAKNMREFLELCANKHLARLGFDTVFECKTNPYPFMNLQNVQSLTNFFERKVADYQVNISGEVSLDEDF